jgi:hypothetical protein
MKMRVGLKIFGVLVVATAITSLAFSDFLSGVGKLLNPENLAKTAGVGIIVKQFGPKINNVVNRITKHKPTSSSTTKVVPILTVGSSNAIGAAQVIGPKEFVNRVSAVAQIDSDLGFIPKVRVRGLIPVANKKLIQIKRVPNVGVSAILDLKL